MSFLTGEGIVGMFVDRRLTLCVGALALCAFIGSAFLYDLVQAANSLLALSLNADRGAVFTSIMVAASIYGREYFWTGIVVVMLVFGKRETKSLAMELAILFLVGVVAGELFKLLIYKPRPFEILAEVVTRVPKDYDSSFPSGHAVIVTIGAAFALLKFQRKSVALLLTLEALIVDYSRIYVGMHYPLDVVAGTFLGAAIVFLGVSFLDKQIGVFFEAMVRFAKTRGFKHQSGGDLVDQLLQFRRGMRI